MSRMNRCALPTSEVAVAICCDRLQSGRSDAGIAVRLTGIDLNPYATRAAAESTPKELGIVWLTGGCLGVSTEEANRIIVSSLMTHHLEDDEIVSLLKWMEANVTLGWFINDLERSKWCSRMFGWVPWHRTVRHDGPVSFRRAFREEDWERLLAMARIPQGGCDDRTLATGTAMCWTVEVKPPFIKRVRCHGLGSVDNSRSTRRSCT